MTKKNKGKVIQKFNAPKKRPTKKERILKSIEKVGGR